MLFTAECTAVDSESEFIDLKRMGRNVINNCNQRWNDNVTKNIAMTVFSKTHTGRIIYQYCFHIQET